MRAGIRSRPWVGLDIGSYSVKLMTLHAGGGARYQAAEVPLPAGNGEASRDQAVETVARTIADGLERIRLSARGLRGVTLGISGADVIVKQITLPLLDDDEVGPALRFEARKHLPFDPQSMVIDFQILGRSPTQKKLEVLLAAVSRDHVERQRAPLQILGLDADIMDATPLALSNGLVHGSEGMREAFLLLDIGHTASHLMLYQRGEPYFSRRLDFGGRDLTRAIAEGTGVPVAEAEEWKLAAGSDPPVFRVDWNSREMVAVLECLRHELVDELRRSFAFYRTLGQLPDPLRLWVSGGSVRLPGLAAQLSELLGSPALVFDPLERLAGSHVHGPVIVGPQFAQAYGLALRTA